MGRDIFWIKDGSWYLVYHSGSRYRDIKISRESVVLFSVSVVSGSLWVHGITGKYFDPLVCSGYLGEPLPMAISGYSW